MVPRWIHPERKPMGSVSVNGSIWKDFDVSKEWVRVGEPGAGKYEVVVRYDGSKTQYSRGSRRNGL
jgi:hypothetical protein